MGHESPVTRLTGHELDLLLTDLVASGLWRNPFPKVDAITMGRILHDRNLEKKMHLVRAAFNTWPPRGAFVVIENRIDDAET